MADSVGPRGGPVTLRTLVSPGEQANKLAFVRVLRVYHGGRDPAHRNRDRALVAQGVDLTLLAPTSWPAPGSQHERSSESFPVVEQVVSRPGDVNRHRYADVGALRRLIREVGPDLLDVHEEPVSVAGRQLLGAAPAGLPVVMYTAQNVDKRFPPPFAQYERCAHRRVAALYPCSRQAASVSRGKGFAGIVEVIPLGYDEDVFRPGDQSPEAGEVVLSLFGRLVPEKGVRDAVRILARVNEQRAARLILVGSGPESGPARELARRLGVGDRLQFEPWLAAGAVADLYRRAHVVLVPSVPTATWTEQFGRIIVEAHASGTVVAGYATGSIPEVAGEAAILTASGDVDGLARHVCALLDDREAYSRLREQGLALSRERTWKQVAARQAALYERVAGGRASTVRLPRSPRARRSRASLEFGGTAPTTAGLRPFALPWLRRGGFVPSVLAAAIDAGAELRVRVGRGSALADEV